MLRGLPAKIKHGQNWTLKWDLREVKKMVVSYAPLGPVKFSRGFPPLPFAAYRPHNSRIMSFFAVFGGSRYT